MFKTVELHRTWKINIDKLPNLSELEFIEHSLVCLSSSNDSLLITMNKETHNSVQHFYISMIDLSGNKISYIVTEEDYEETKTLIGKSLDKKVYVINSKTNPSKNIHLDVYKNLKLITANYYATSKITLNSFIIENWFGEEVDNLSLNDNELFNKVN